MTSWMPILRRNSSWSTFAAFGARDGGHGPTSKRNLTFEAVPVAAYEIVFTTSAEREFRKLPRDLQRRFATAFVLLREDPEGVD